MKLLMLGAPGAGKGTMAELLAKKLNLPHISTGEILRQEVKSGSPLGKEVKNIIERGELVNDALMIAIVGERLKQADCQSGFILDGLPRTVVQAEGLKNLGIVFDHVIVLEVSDALVIERLTGRRIHPASGRTYHATTHPPKVADRDDQTGEPLIQRKDDAPETVKKRLAVYHTQTKPLIAYYQAIVRLIDGHGTIETVLKDCLASVSTQ